LGVGRRPRSPRELQKTGLKLAKKRKVTQPELAYLTGIPLSRIQRYERGEADPPLIDLTLMALALGRDPVEMFKLTMVKLGISTRVSSARPS
jgi:transcriptional regulator with XRE-family HTH domain